MCRPLTKEYQEVAKSIFLTSTGSSAVMKNKSHKDYQEKITGLWSNMKLFEKGIKQFEGLTFIDGSSISVMRESRNP